MNLYPKITIRHRLGTQGEGIAHSSPRRRHTGAPRQPGDPHVYPVRLTGLQRACAQSPAVHADRRPSELRSQAESW